MTHSRVDYDVLVIGGGQSGLACGYYLRRTGLKYAILDNQTRCGGAWQHGWDSLTLFSPARYSSLPGRLMPGTEHDYPKKKEVLEYLCDYERRYDLPIQRPVQVESIEKDTSGFRLLTQQGTLTTRAIISCTGTWTRPFIPDVPGRNTFQGLQLHSATYQTPEQFRGLNTLIVGEGNSGAQILAEVSQVASVYWAISREPDFLPDDIDGKVLFDVASAKYYAQQRGETLDPARFNLGNIVMVPAVKEARDRGLFQNYYRIQRLEAQTVVWENGHTQPIDAIIWCTGFRAATQHLQGIVQPDHNGRIPVNGTRSREEPGLWLVGYGGWTGFASATLIGVGRSARSTVDEIKNFLQKNDHA
jgi:putative flavoprotein involved in K+ transport